MNENVNYQDELQQLVGQALGNITPRDATLIAAGAVIQEACDKLDEIASQIADFAAAVTALSNAAKESITAKSNNNIERDIRDITELVLDIDDHSNVVHIAISNLDTAVSAVEAAVTTAARVRARE